MYDNNINQFQTILSKCAKKAATEQNQETGDKNVESVFQISKPPKMECPLNVANERQLSKYTVTLFNHNRLANSKQSKYRQNIIWGSQDEKPENHPDEIVEWTDFEVIAKKDKKKFPIAPNKPKK
jgi:hypothetical protein